MTSTSGTNSCLTCDLASAPKLGERVSQYTIHHDDVVICNHYVGSDAPGDHPDDRAGWLIVSPVRHLTNVHQLTGLEWKRLGAVIRLADKALSELYGAGRCLVSSLGWNREDHIHFHVVPTALAPRDPETGIFDRNMHPDVTFGWLNFGGPTSEHPNAGAYVPVDDLAADVASQVKAFIQPRLLGRLPHHYDR